jgi:hypothetical protein
MTDEYVAAIVVIGGKEDNGLTDATVRKMREAPAMVHSRHPNAKIMLCVNGYDDDPRELYDIPEAADYVRRFAAASGLHDWTTPLFQALDEQTIGMLVLCDAIDKPHPYEVSRP